MMRRRTGWWTAVIVSMETMPGTLGGVPEIDKASCTSPPGRVGAAVRDEPGGPMIFICVEWRIKREHADEWPEITRSFTEAARAEEGNLFFEWSRSGADPEQYVL